ncbi:MAG: O-antigen ligase family protein [Actinomycetota bacterium]
MTSRQVAPTIGFQPDWIVVALPLVLTSRNLLPAKIVALGLLILTAAVFSRKPEIRYPVHAGPMVLLFASFAIVFARPQTNLIALTTFALTGVLLLVLVSRVDGRVLISSFIDGWGLFLFVNVLAHRVGLSSAHAASFGRIGSGFNRITFPLTSGWNSPAAIAGAYLVASIFLAREGGWGRKSLRVLYALSAIMVFAGTGTRSAMGVALIIAAIAIWFPASSRWIAQATTAFAAISALVLPFIIDKVAFIVRPLSSLTPGRGGATLEQVALLSGRVEIWDSSLTYWKVWVNGLMEMLFGFGPNGQYISGASLTYKSVVVSLRSDPEYATVHNAFLQEFYDGGLIGWLILFLALYWTSTRLSKRRSDWNPWASSAIFALTAILVGSMTESQMAPGVLQESFWMMIGLIAIACQTRQNDEPQKAKSIHTESQQTLPEVSAGQAAIPRFT